MSETTQSGPVAPVETEPAGSTAKEPLSDRQLWQSLGLEGKAGATSVRLVTLVRALQQDPLLEIRQVAAQTGIASHKFSTALADVGFTFVRFRQHLEELGLIRTRPQVLTERAKSVLALKLLADPANDPLVGVVARELEISQWDLSRNVVAAGHPWRELLVEVRRELGLPPSPQHYFAELVKDALRRDRTLTRSEVAKRLDRTDPQLMAALRNIGTNFETLRDEVLAERAIPNGVPPEVLFRRRALRAAALQFGVPGADDLVKALQEGFNISRASVLRDIAAIELGDLSMQGDVAYRQWHDVRRRRVIAALEALPASKSNDETAGIQEVRAALNALPGTIFEYSTHAIGTYLKSSPLHADRGGS